MASLRLTRRMFRSGIHWVLPRGVGGYLVCVGNTTITLEIGTDKQREHPLQLRGSRPLLPAALPDGRIILGEYFSNPSREPVRCLVLDPGADEWRELCQMKGIRHIHGVFFDPVSQQTWLSTGDEDGECGLFILDGDTAREVIRGGQELRMVQPLFLKEGIVYGTDSPQGENSIRILSRDTLRHESLAPVPGPVFWAGRARGLFAFSTVVEPGSMRRERNATLWVSRDGSVWSEAARYPWDGLPLRLFQYPQLRFPLLSDELPPTLIFSTSSVDPDERIFFLDEFHAE